VETPAASEAAGAEGDIVPVDSRNRQHQQPLPFPIGARRFIGEWNAHGPAHHAPSVAIIASKIEKLGRLLGFQTARVG